MKKQNPIAAQVQPLQGQPLPADWARQAAQNQGGAFDRRDLENMWKQPNWTAKINSENVVRDARLSRHPSWEDLTGKK